MHVYNTDPARTFSTVTAFQGTRCMFTCMLLCQGTGEPVGQFGVFDLSARLRRAGLFRRTDLNAFGGQI